MCMAYSFQGLRPQTTFFKGEPGAQPFARVK